MSPAKWTSVLVLSLPAIFAQAPLPDLRVEAAPGGSVLYVHNTSAQPLTAFLIELVGYPGSSWAHSQDDLRDLIPAGGEKRIPVTSMTVGAVPEYVKMQAAIYADGTSAGIPEKVAQMIDRRRVILETTRELIRRLQAGEDQPTVTAGMKEWVASVSRPGQNRQGVPSVNRLAAMSVISRAATDLEKGSVEQALAALRASERLLAASKPPLQ
jgi:hypothetical protein